MSSTYNLYLDQHIQNIANAYDWLRTYLPEVTSEITNEEVNDIVSNHDESKYSPEEYDAYDNYFYGKNRTSEVVEEFNKAWLHHIHRNPHHWQHYVLINDETDEGIVALDMPYNRIVEMICDWWSFSWSTGNLYEIFDWYDQHKDHIRLSNSTRVIVENILDKIKKELDEGDI